MRAAIYARTSTGSQDVGMQLDELREAARARGFEVEEYVDQGESGAKASRPALDRLLADAKRRRFAVVLVWKLDRLGRSLADLLRIVSEFESAGVELVSLRDPGLDTTSAHGRLVFSIMGSVAEFERALIRERVCAGLARAKRAPRPGKRRPGRPRAAVDVETARRALAAGEGLAACARRLGASRTTLRRALERTSG